MWNPKPRTLRFVLKPILHLLILLPLARMVAGIFTHSLGANPVEAITSGTGEWGLRLLLLTLAVSPLRLLTRATWLTQFRRLLGLWAFFYIFLHLLIFLVLDNLLILADIWADILSKPFITIGMLAFVLMVPLAITSFTALRRKMGRSWNRLHRLIYLIAPLGILHYWLLVKADIREPLVYALICALLLAFRLPPLRQAIQNQQRNAQAKPRHSSE